MLLNVNNSDTVCDSFLQVHLQIVRATSKNLEFLRVYLLIFSDFRPNATRGKTEGYLADVRSKHGICRFHRVFLPKLWTTVLRASLLSRGQHVKTIECPGRARARLQVGYDSIAPRSSEFEGPSFARLQLRLRFRTRTSAKLRANAQSRARPPKQAPHQRKGVGQGWAQARLKLEREAALHY